MRRHLGCECCVIAKTLDTSRFSRDAGVVEEHLLFQTYGAASVFKVSV